MAFERGTVDCCFSGSWLCVVAGGFPHHCQQQQQLLKLASPTGTGHRARRKGWMRELSQSPQLLWLPWVVMSRAPDWREQQNSHFLPCWGPASCGCQPGGGVKLLVAAETAPALALPWPLLCPLVPWCPALPNSVGFWGHTLCSYIVKTTLSPPKVPRVSPSF